MGEFCGYDARRRSALFPDFLLPEAPGSAEEGTGTVTRGYRTAAPSKSRDVNPPEFPIFSPF